MQQPVILSLASGKGGVGKTLLASNLGLLLSQQLSTLLIDADWNLGKLGLLFDEKAKWTIEDVLLNAINLSDAVSEVRPGLHLLNAPSGSLGFNALLEDRSQEIFFALSTLMANYQFVVLDHGSGIHEPLLPFIAASHYHAIVSSTEPTSLKDSYAIIKLLSKRFSVKEFILIPTFITYPSIEDDRIQRFVNFVMKELWVKVTVAPVVPFESKLKWTALNQALWIEKEEHHSFSTQLKRIAYFVKNLPKKQSPSFSYLPCS